ncbi:MAG: hypothetical protein NTV51_27830 [Verrucomicrobia bacterium]|nr:hypothetical protein [Verrucomicrobiota bacterium]
MQTAFAGAGTSCYPTGTCGRPARAARAYAWWLAVCALLVFASPAPAADLDVDQIVREVHAKKLTVIFGEQELCKQGALATLATMAKQYPETPAIMWSRVGHGLDFDAFEEAITKHYAASFTADELKYLAGFFDPPEMRGLVFWVRIMAENPPSPADLPVEIGRLRKKYGDLPVARLGELFNSALGRTLVEVQKSAAEIRRREAIAALVASHQRVRSGR